jgi:hypothetical protein
MKLKKILLIQILLLPVLSFSQEKTKLPLMEDTLVNISRKIMEASTDSEKLILTSGFSNTLLRAIKINESFSYPFDSLRTLSKLISPDKRFRIYNWNLPLTSGSNLYFCIIQIPGKKKEGNRIFELIDCSDSIKDPEFAVLPANKWYGALYYRIIAVQQGHKTLYTLLGWDGASTTVTQKIIEILSFDQKGLPKFGAKIFRDYLKGPRTRIIFRYSSTASMLLRPDEQYVKSGKSKKSAKLIVCDRLVALDSRMEGQTDFYVPASDIYDGFIFLNGNWKFTRGIEGRNH